MSPPAPVAPTAAPAAPATASRAGLAASLAPELLSLATALAVALALLPVQLAPAAQQALAWAVMAEAATAMFLCTVVDIASRLRRAPPAWAGVLVAAGVLLVYPEVPQLARALFEESLWVGLPFAWSVLERLRELWTLPGQPALEKLRRRTLTFDRLYSGMVVAGVALAIALAVAMIGDDSVAFGDVVARFGPGFVAAFYALCAWNALRVHRAAFAARPRSLWPRIDGGQVADLDPL
jgi:hypothetical protein